MVRNAKLVKFPNFTKDLFKKISSLTKIFIELLKYYVDGLLNYGVIAAEYVGLMLKVSQYKYKNVVSALILVH